MAITPLYNSESELLTFLRLSESSVTEPILQLGLMEFELQAKKILGDVYAQSLIDKDNACKVAEYKYLKYFVIMESPVTLIGTTVSSREVWNNESTTRENGSSENASTIAYRLKSEALNLLGMYLDEEGSLDNVVLTFSTTDPTNGDIFDI